MTEYPYLTLKQAEEIGGADLVHVLAQSLNDKDIDWACKALEGYGADVIGRLAVHEDGSMTVTNIIFGKKR